MSTARRLAHLYVRWRARRSLDGVHARGLERARAVLAREPLIVAANHVAWWDGLLMLLLDRALAADARFVMDAANLRRLPFLRPLGAIGLPLDQPLAMRAVLRRAAAHLDGPGRVVWVFPQGRQRPAHLRPLGLQRGVEVLQRMSGARVLPAALTYGWRDDLRPAAVVGLGPPLEAGTDLVFRLEAALCDELDAHGAWLDGEGPDPVALLAGRGRRVQDGLGARLLTAVTRGGDRG